MANPKSKLKKFFVIIQADVSAMKEFSRKVYAENEAAAIEVAKNKIRDAAFKNSDAITFYSAEASEIETTYQTEKA